jgi:hypothetical protein
VSGTGEALRTLAPFAGAIAASPVAIGVALVILLGRRGRHHIWVFLGTWFAAITGATVVILHLLPTVGQRPGRHGPRRWAASSASDCCCSRPSRPGAWHRSRGAPSLVSRLVAHLDRPHRARGVIAAVFAINPVHLALTTAGVDAIPGSAPAGLVALVVAVVFAAIASLPLLLVAGTVVALPNRRPTPRCVGVNTWLRPVTGRRQPACRR